MRNAHYYQEIQLMRMKLTRNHTSSCHSWNLSSQTFPKNHDLLFSSFASSSLSTAEVESSSQHQETSSEIIWDLELRIPL
jgi:hypothetical protein